MKEIVLDVQEVTIAFGGLKAVDQVSFQIYTNEIFGLIGPNGAGKTTLFNCITQFYKPNHGQVIFMNNKGQRVNLVGQKVHKIISMGLVRTFQNVELIKELSIEDNLLVGAHTQFRSGLLSQLFRLKKARVEEQKFIEQAQAILKKLNLYERKDQLVQGQPYGILKKVELGRTLMANPKLIILDEPAAGLDHTETEQLAETIRSIREEFNCSVLLVEHDMKLVMNLCDRICAISFGKQLAVGTPEEVQQSAAVQEAYLGKGDEDE